MASVCYVGWWINQVTATFITVCTGAGSEQTGPLYRGNPAPSRAEGFITGADKTRTVTSGVTGDSGHQGDLHTVPVG